MSIHTRGPLSCVGGPIGHTWANAGVATTAAAVPSTARRDICSENRWLLISIVSPVFKRSLLNLSSNRLCNNAIGGGCPLWVKSRHMRCTGACPLYPRKQTFAVQQPMSAMGQSGHRSQFRGAPDVSPIYLLRAGEAAK